MLDLQPWWRPSCALTSALNGASKGAQRRLRASVFERAVRGHSLVTSPDEYQIRRY